MGLLCGKMLLQQRIILIGVLLLIPGIILLILPLFMAMEQTGQYIIRYLDGLIQMVICL
nr:MAG TPA: hypothetical protein [Caudoviricetes sp.]